MAARAVGKRSGRQNHRKIARRGLMFVLSSPSGAGKTTLSRMLLKADRNIALSVSVTTRPKRRGEVNGRDYHFIDRRPLHRDGEIRRSSGMGGGVRPSLRHAAPPGGAGVAAPAATCCSTSTGRARSNCGKRRATIWSASLFCRRASTNWSGGCTAAPRTPTTSSSARMAKAAGEMSHWPEYDYVIVNSDIGAGLRRNARHPRRRAAQARTPNRIVGFRARAAGEAVRTTLTRIPAA